MAHVPPSDGRHPTTAKPLALTMGEPSGIGPDITLAAWTQRAACGLPAFAALACPDLLAERAHRIGVDVPIAVIERIEDAAKHFTTALPVVPVRLRARVEPGMPDTANAASVLASIEQAVSATADGRACAIVTNPIAKSVLYKAGFSHPGHTEYLAALAGLHDPSQFHIPVMMLASQELRVVPLTIHIPLASVPRAITAELIATTVRILAAALVNDFAISRPRIAVAGLNPHAGEDGALGGEEIEIIGPALDRLRQQGIEVTGPLPADTMFHAAARQRYDAAVAMYHDQALIPIKTLAFDRGVNVTLGLPFVRTSPDHGTAFDIAGKGTASAASLIEALKLAAAMAARRSAARRP